MKYIVVKKETVKKDLMEKNFCFYCGCFQGGTGTKTVAKS